MRRANDVASAEPGEILSRAPDRFAGYTDPRERGVHRRRRLVQHGDIGIIDADGYLTITAG